MANTKTAAAAGHDEEAQAVPAAATPATMCELNDPTVADAEAVAAALAKQSGEEA
jgi:hypothetical protein